MELETDRLILLPLDVNLLSLWTSDISALELAIDCRYDAEPMEGDFLEIVKGQLSITRGDPDHYLYHSFWLLIRKSDRTVVGSADFKGKPDEQGQVEIGYGLGPKYEHKGYMTEAVDALCRWVLRQEGVNAVIAETYSDGYASQRILTRCGFIRDREAESIWWKRVASGDEKDVPVCGERP
ncbi:MAG: GNAT family N-acetyltransferase [Planctomycetia bacterium]|nr:GNAT family N-acetyltransferase [Planctomycetia bacterium]